MKDRITYIDALKGIAMLLVIMGHCVAAQFIDYREALDGPREFMLLWRIIYSFHMPLFAFCSGLLMAKTKEFYTAKNISNTLLKRIKSLLIPFTAVGGIWFVIDGYWGDHYWFLIVIWECVVIHLIIGLFCSLCPKWSEHIESIAMSIVAIISFYAYNYLSQFNIFPILDFSRFHHLFPYYTLGLIAMRYNLIERIVVRNWAYAIALSCFVVFTYLLTYKGYTLPLGKLTNRVIPVSAICFMTYWCNCTDFAQSKIYGILSNIGQHSLEIYIVHSFILFPLYFIGDISMQLCEMGGYYNGVGVFFLQLIASIIATTIILLCCYGVIWIIGKNPILSQLFLGRKYA